MSYAGSISVMANNQRGKELVMSREEKIREEEEGSREGWEPRILAFACHYCAFAAADLAGIMRLSYQPNIRIIRLTCTGKLDHIHVVRAFEQGIDGVFVAG